MLSKKIKTVSKCADAITAYKTFSAQVPEMVSALSGFLYAAETDKAIRLMEDLQTILCKARDRAERDFDAISKDNELRRRGGDADA